MEQRSDLRYLVVASRVAIRGPNALNLSSPGYSACSHPDRDARCVVRSCYSRICLFAARSPDNCEIELGFAIRGTLTRQTSFMSCCCRNGVCEVHDAVAVAVWKALRVSLRCRALQAVSQSEAASPQVHCGGQASHFTQRVVALGQYMHAKIRLLRALQYASRCDSSLDLEKTGSHSKARKLVSTGATISRYRQLNQTLLECA